MNIFVPTFKPDTRALAVVVGSVNVAVPEVIAQLPVPDTGTVAPNCAVPSHDAAGDTPALADILYISTVLMDDGQVPLVTVHVNVFFALDTKLFTVVVPSVELIKLTPPPALHVPMPDEGLVALSVAVLLHTVCVTPAYAADG